MQLSVHLQAADIHELHATFQTLPRRGDSRLSAFEEERLAVGIDRPGPGLHLSGRRDRPATLHLGEAAEKVRGQLVFCLSCGDRRPAQGALGGQPVRHRSSRGKPEQAEQRELMKSKTTHQSGPGSGVRLDRFQPDFAG
jgi:hypothetical protein